MAVRIVWYMHRVEGRAQVSVQEIVSFFAEQSISHPNASRLGSRLAADRRVLRDSKTSLLRLKTAALDLLDQELGETSEPSNPMNGFVKKLEEHAENITDNQTKAFVKEAIGCVKAGIPRAAVIMSWCGAVSVLQNYVIKNHLNEFNDDAVKNNLLKCPAKNIADIRDITKESQFLESMARISIIDDSTKRALKRCLDRRNEVGHPSEIRISDSTVADHIDTLTLNVFARFGT